MKIYTEAGIQEIQDIDTRLKDYQKIMAAGGVVLNGEGDVLLIFRRGKWDLPKGKVEENEPIEFCAERETKEETGLTHVTLQKLLVITYHSYEEKGQPVIKETHWFQYETEGIPALTPQTNEDIFKAEWVAPGKLPEYMSNTFQLIRDVLREAGLFR